MIEWLQAATAVAGVGMIGGIVLWGVLGMNDPENKEDETHEQD